jgi:hypothetical protein
LVLTTDWQNDDELEGPIRAYIEDAIEDCIKAKHDAIDAALSFVTSGTNPTDGTLRMSRKAAEYLGSAGTRPSDFHH